MEERYTLMQVKTIRQAGQLIHLQIQVLQFQKVLLLIILLVFQGVQYTERHGELFM